MPRSYQNLRNNMSQSSQNKANEKAELMMAEMPLNELHVAKQLSQESMAKILNSASV